MGLLSAKCVSVVRLDGKTAVITGSNTGIGRETAKDFFIRGAKVIMACRNLTKANVAAKDIRNECEGQNNLGNLEIIHLDLSSIKSIKECASKLVKEERIDLLVNNAGVMLCPLWRTEDNFEMQFGTNHLGHFLFTLLLLPKILSAPAARIITVSSIAHKRGKIDFDDLNWNIRPYSSLGAYCQSKLANVLFTKELANRLNSAGISNVKTYSLHPGVINTELSRHLGKTTHFIWSLFSVFFKTPVQGAQTTIYCAVSKEVAEDNGLYYAECKATPCSDDCNNAEASRRLWNESLRLVKIDLPENYGPFKQNAQHLTSIEKQIKLGTTYQEVHQALQEKSTN